MARAFARCLTPVLLLLGGCAAGAPYRPPDLAVPATFSETADGAARRPDVGAWWTAFQDPVLNDLVSRALSANPDVRIAATRIRQAREQERITGASRRPTATATGQAAYTRLSENAIPAGLANLGAPTPGQSPSNALGLPGSDFDTFQAGFDATWEIDLFGGQRRAVEAATARTDAAVWSARDAEVLDAAEVANAYLQYRTLQRRIALADEGLAAQRELADFVQVRARNGLVTSLDVRRQQREVEQLAAAREDLIAQRDARLHALGVLLGEPPLALAQRLAAPAPWPVPPLAIPAGLPSELLLRRPDLRAAERRLAAATADTGVAVADLYPRISLTGAVQLVSTSLASLLSADSLQLNGAARVGLPILDGGRRRATVRLREAQAQEALIAYQSEVLTALKDVEDALTRLEADRRRDAQLRAAERAAADAADTTLVRYRSGLVPFLEVLEARQAWVAARDAAAQGEAAAAQDSVALYKALGGGWDDRRAPSAEGDSVG